MLLIPIGQKENVVRRLPWVSFALIALCFVVFGLQSAGGQRAEAEADRALGAYLEYLGERPWLEPSAQMRERLGSGFDTALDEARATFAESGARRPPAGGTQQQELDDLDRAALVALAATPSARYGFVPARANPLTAISSQFLHGGWFHLLGNMLFLFVTAPFLEDVWGRPLFAGFYLVSGAVAAYSHGFASPHSLSPLIGASGAIAGVMGAFLVRFGSRRMEFLWLPIPLLFFLRRRVVLPAFVFLPMWLGEQLLYARNAGSGGAGVAWWAHVGGFSFGFAVALALRLARVEERFVAPAIQKQISLEQDPSLEAALEARVRGDLAGARRELRRALHAQPNGLDAWREAWELALATRDGVEAARAATWSCARERASPSWRARSSTTTAGGTCRRCRPGCGWRSARCSSARATAGAPWTASSRRRSRSRATPPRCARCCAGRSCCAATGSGTTPAWCSSALLRTPPVATRGPPRSPRPWPASRARPWRGRPRDRPPGGRLGSWTRRPRRLPPSLLPRRAAPRAGRGRLRSPPWPSWASWSAAPCTCSTRPAACRRR